MDACTRWDTSAAALWGYCLARGNGEQFCKTTNDVITTLVINSSNNNGFGESRLTYLGIPSLSFNYFLPSLLNSFSLDIIVKKGISSFLFRHLRFLNELFVRHNGIICEAISVNLSLRSGNV